MKRKPPKPVEDVSQSRYLNVAEAALYLRKTEKSVRHLIERDLIPFIQQGRSILFDREALDRWMAGLTQISPETALQHGRGVTEKPIVAEAVGKALTRVGTYVGTRQVR